MKAAVTAFLFLAACSLGWPQEIAPVGDLSAKPHHKLIFENSKTRVFRLSLQPGEATLPHRHKNPYAYVSLSSSTIANEVRGREPVVVNLDSGDVHTSRGGFALAEKNQSSTAALLIVVEAVEPEGGTFAVPMGGFRFHDAAFGEMFQLPMFRGYTMTIAAGGRTEKHEDKYDRLLIAMTDLNLRDDIDGQSAAQVAMKAGDVSWFPRGAVHGTTNVGASPATFITLEFN